MVIEAWILWDFINNADDSRSSSPLGVLLEAPLGGYWRLKIVFQFPSQFLDIYLEEVEHSTQSSPLEQGRL